MEVSFGELKEKELVNIFDGKKLGRIIDIVFDNETGVVRGIVVPGERKIFKKNEDIFIALDKLKKIGDDVILVRLPVNDRFIETNSKKLMVENKYNYYGNSGFDNKSINGYSNRNRGYNITKAGQFAGEAQNNYQISKENDVANKKSYVRFKPINNIKYK